MFDFAQLNLLTLVVSSVAFYVYYLKSVRPAKLEQSVGSKAYQQCAHYRFLSGIYMTIASVNYLVYYFFPLSILLSIFPRTFPWPHWWSILLATWIGIPCGYLLWRGMKDAGEETMTPKKEHSLYGGIYQCIRHPQGVGEMPLWWVMALACHSPFLTCWSCLYIPVWAHMCLAEEEDLVLRYGSPYKEYQAKVGAFFPKSWTALTVLWSGRDREEELKHHSRSPSIPSKDKMV